jgi:thymidylate kinase
MIVFSGLDGAGKSTQINILIDFYQNKRKRVYYFWSRGGYTPGMLFLKALLRKSGSNIIPKKSGESIERDKSFKNSRIQKAWITLAIIDLIIFYGIWLRFKCIKNIVICDRYLIDTQIDFERNFPTIDVQRLLLWKLLVCIAPKPDFHFLLMITPKESVTRSIIKNEPFPDTLETLNFRYEKYDNLSLHADKIIRVDCSAEVEEVADFIASTLR